MAEKPNMQKAEMNIGCSGSLLPFNRSHRSCRVVEFLKRGLRRARRRVSKKIIEVELKEKNAKAHHR